MANSWYDKGLENILDGDISWSANTIKTLLRDEDVGTGGTAPNLTTDDALDDIVAGARVGGLGPALTTKTGTNGYLDADNVTHTSVSGDTVESFEILKDSGVESTSYLLLNFDTATGLPLTPDGGNVTITWQGTSPWIARI